jgi:hypothetical protein
MQPNTTKNAAPKAAAPTAPTPKVSKSRLPVAAVAAALLGVELTVKAVAEKLKITERDVRLSIDTLRRKGGYKAVERTAPATFTIRK